MSSGSSGGGGAELDFDPELDPSPQASAGRAPRAALAAALAAARQGLKPGEDPFDYDLTEGVGTGPAPASEAKVYIAPTETTRRRRHDTLELIEKVKVAPAIDPRRAVTVLVRLPGAAKPAQGAAEPLENTNSTAPGEPSGEARPPRRRGWALGLLLLVAAAAAVGAGWSQTDARTAEEPKERGAASNAAASAPMRIAERPAPGPMATAAPPALPGTGAPRILPLRPRPPKAPSPVKTPQRMFGSEP